MPEFYAKHLLGAITSQSKQIVRALRLSVSRPYSDNQPCSRDFRHKNVDTHFGGSYESIRRRQAYLHACLFGSLSRHYLVCPSLLGPIERGSSRPGCRIGI